MNIVNIIHRFHPAIGGIEGEILQLSEKMVEKGHDISIFTTYAKNMDDIQPINLLKQRSPLLYRDRNLKNFEIYKNLKINRFAHVRLPLNKLFCKIHEKSGIFIWGPHFPQFIFKKELKNCDIIHSTPFTDIYNVYSLCAKKIYNKKLIFTPCIHPLDKFQFSKELVYKIMNKADGLIAKTEYEKQVIDSKCKKPSIAIGPGIDIADFDNADGRNFKNMFNIEDFILFIGRKSYYKGLDILMEAIKGTDYKLVIIGEDTEEWDLIRLKFHKEIAEHQIIDIGRVDDETKKNAIDACSLMVLPSKNESFGNVFLEAWIRKKPVIGCDTLVIRSLIDNEKDGLLFRIEDSKDLRSKITLLMNNRRIANMMGENGYIKTQEFSWDKQTEKTIKFFEDIKNNNV